MRIALLGYGRMGREVESAAEAGGHTVVVRTDIDNPDDFNSSTASGCCGTFNLAAHTAVSKQSYSHLKRWFQSYFGGLIKVLYVKA